MIRQDHPDGDTLAAPPVPLFALSPLCSPAFVHVAPAPPSHHVVAHRSPQKQQQHGSGPRQAPNQRLPGHGHLAVWARVPVRWGGEAARGGNTGHRSSTLQGAWHGGQEELVTPLVWGGATQGGRGLLRVGAYRWGVASWGRTTRRWGGARGWVCGASC